MEKTLGKKISQKGFVVGPFMKSSDPAFVEIAGYAGFDFVILDMEHGSVHLQQMQNMIRAAEVSDISTVIRLRDRMPETISQALDIGAHAIQVPQITTEEEVRNIIEASKFFPDGNRGVCRFVRAAKYSGMSSSYYFEKANQTQIIIQVEGLKAIENIESILQVNGFDILFIGPYDLSQSLGVPGKINHPKVISAMKNLIKKAKEAQKYIGVFIDTIDNAMIWRNMGVHYLAYSVDVGIYFSACKSVVDEIHK
ncbi:MAG: HpcH/HpaI aldolase family protein [Bacteroidota bacterium]